MFVLFVTILLDFTIMTTEYVLAYAIAHQRQEREESRREREEASEPRVAHYCAYCQPSLSAVFMQNHTQ